MIANDNLGDPIEKKLKRIVTDRSISRFFKNMNSYEDIATPKTTIRKLDYLPETPFSREQKISIIGRKFLPLTFSKQLFEF